MKTPFASLLLCVFAFKSEAQTNLITFVSVVTNEMTASTCVIRSPTNEILYTAVWRRVETNYTQITQVSPNEPPDVHVRKTEFGEWKLLLVPATPETGRVRQPPPLPGGFQSFK